MVGVASRSVYRALEHEQPPTRHRRHWTHHAVDPYMSYLTKRWNDGCHKARGLYEEIVAHISRNREGKPDFEQWKGAVRASGIPELKDFVEGLADDTEAVVNGCTESRSNGMVEGFINKVKWIT